MYVMISTTMCLHVTYMCTYAGFQNTVCNLPATCTIQNERSWSTKPRTTRKPKASKLSLNLPYCRT